MRTRPLTIGEHEALLLLSSRVTTNKTRQQFIRDLVNCQVEDVLSDGSRLSFHLSAYDRPKYKGQHAFEDSEGRPVEGIVMDRSGEELDVWIFADPNDRVLELELAKAGPEMALNPDWETFRLK